MPQFLTSCWLSLRAEAGLNLCRLGSRLERVTWSQQAVHLHALLLQRLSIRINNISCCSCFWTKSPIKDTGKKCFILFFSADLKTAQTAIVKRNRTLSLYVFMTSILESPLEICPRVDFSEGILFLLYILFYFTFYQLNCLRLYRGVRTDGKTFSRLS